MIFTKKSYIAGLLFFTMSLGAEKYVIGCWNAGFFSTFLGVLNQLDWCEKNNLTPTVYWNNSCNFACQGTNCIANNWENYFEPVSSLVYSPGDLIHNQYEAPNGMSTFFMGNNSKDSRSLANSLILKYIKIKPAILEKIDLFYDTYMRGKKTIGLHIRGTDKPKEIKQVPLDQIINESLKYADETTQFFIASEDLKLFEQAKMKLNGKVVISQDCIRITCPAWLCVNDRVTIGQEVLIDAILLSRCDRLIHTASNVSTAALFFNKDLPNTMLSKKGFVCGDSDLDNDVGSCIYD